DAMIHDSGAFLIEYFYINKPVMFLISSEKVKEEFNKIGREALSLIYKGYSQSDIINFVNKVLNNKDSNEQKRKEFFDKIIKLTKKLSETENIYNYIKCILEKNEE